MANNAPILIIQEIFTDYYIPLKFGTVIDSSFFLLTKGQTMLKYSREREEKKCIRYLW